MNRDVSCRVVIPIFRYAIKHGVKVDQLASGIIEKQYMENPNNWISRDLVVELFNRCEKVFNDPFIMYKIGLEGWSHQKGAYSSFVRLLLRPSLIFKFMPKLNSMQVNFFKMHIERIKHNQVEFKISYTDNSMAHRHGCLLNLGFSASFPTYVWKVSSDIVEHECVCDCELESIANLNSKPKMIRNVNFGSNHCVYMLRWEKNLPNKHAVGFSKNNQELLENTIDELLKAESNAPIKFTKPNPTIIGLKLTELNLFSPREIQIITLVSQGMKNKEIAQHLFISSETVKKHLNNVYRRMGVTSRLELIAKIYEQIVNILED
ncbi:response regulator transcription factor [Desulfosarcina sp.]|uniref:response regulator transcription factor n=1 Tax=Desulfosarcina sp. TaxID=2027861 RepID=UPI00356149BB